MADERTSVVGDVVGGLTIAGAISAALYRRATTGEPSVVDASLFASGIWQIQSDIMNAKLQEGAPARRYDRYASWNPLTLSYRTADGRFIALMTLAADRHWENFCTAIGHPELIHDPRFVDMKARQEHCRACVETLESIFVEKNLDGG